MGPGEIIAGGIAAAFFAVICFLLYVPFWIFEARAKKRRLSSIVNALDDGEVVNEKQVIWIRNKQLTVTVLKKSREWALVRFSDGNEQVFSRQELGI